MNLLKLSDNPAMSWPEGISVAQFSGTWWLVHTKSRNEKALAKTLAGKSIHYFLPMSLNVKRQRGRTFKTMLPIFSGYLFFCGSENERVDILRTNRAAHIIEIKDQEKLIRQLLPIEQVLQSGMKIIRHKGIKIGQRCRVTAGALADIEGVVVKNNNLTRLVLEIDILGQAASVEIDSEMIEVIDD